MTNYQYLALARTVGTRSTRFTLHLQSFTLIQVVRTQAFRFSSAAKQRGSTPPPRLPCSTRPRLYGPRSSVGAAKARAGELMRVAKRVRSGLLRPERRARAAPRDGVVPAPSCLARDEEPCRRVASGGWMWSRGCVQCRGRDRERLRSGRWCVEAELTYFSWAYIRCFYWATIRAAAQAAPDGNLPLHVGFVIGSHRRLGL